MGYSLLLISLHDVWVTIDNALNPARGSNRGTLAPLRALLLFFIDLRLLKGIEIEFTLRPTVHTQCI